MHPPLFPVALPKRQPLPPSAFLLAADVGGTKIALALLGIRDGTPIVLKEATYPSSLFGSMTEAIQHFSDVEPARLSIAFAGPVQNGKAKATNLGWSIDAAVLGKELDIPEVILLNDLEAWGYGLAALTKKDVTTIHSGAALSTGNAAVVAPGTGLGEGGLFWDGHALHPFATEGGHSDFAPRDEFDCELFLFLQKQYGRVSWERVVSGPGIHQIYRFLRDVKNHPPSTKVEENIRTLDPAAAISKGAQEGNDICVETLRLFARYLAVEASNLALKLKATGGIFIGGGIPPKIWNQEIQTVFLQHFFEVGRLRPLIETVPVHLVSNEKTTLLGAGWYGHGQTTSH
jgi:glucokinase